MSMGTIKWSRTPCAAAAALAICSGASAFEIPTDVDGLTLRFDNTLKYSVAQRLEAADPKLLADVNLDDADRNFKRGGLISNRIDLLSEFDAAYQNVGLRISGAAWYDDVYMRSNDNNSPFTINHISTPYNEFALGTRDLHGRKAEFLDAFVYGRADVGDMLLTGRLGQHTIVFGESLFFGANGIAAAQAPIDYMKLISVPGTPFKEIMRPVPQISGQIQLTPNASIGAYYQFEWEKDRLPAAGSYFSSVDILDDGGELILMGPGFALSRGKDARPTDSGQGGLQFKFRPEGGDTDYGFYAVRWHAKAPITLPDVPNGSFHLIYPEGISAFGASLSTTVLDSNVGAEVSVRHNMPLVPQAGQTFTPTGYPVGKTFHAQVSWITLLHNSPFWQGGQLLGEIAYHRITSVDSNESALDPNGTRSAAALRILFTPAYYQVASGWDLSVPIGLGYGLSGRSLVLHPGFSPRGTGDFSIGVNADYDKVWHFSLNYTKFLGSADTILTPANSPAAAYSYKQSLADRDFISFALRRTF